MSKKELKQLKEIASILPVIPGRNHFRRLKKLYTESGVTGMNAYLTDVDKLITPIVHDPSRI